MRPLGISRGLGAAFVVLVLVSLVGVAQTWRAEGVLNDYLVRSLAASDGGLQGALYQSDDFQAPPCRRVAWDGSPLPGEGHPWFQGSYLALRLAGALKAERGGEYGLRLTSDDGARLFLDGRPILDDWGYHVARARESRVELEPGRHLLWLEYRNGPKYGRLVLEWRPPGQADFSPVPPASLIPVAESWDPGRAGRLLAQSRRAAWAAWLACLLAAGVFLVGWAHTKGIRLWPQRLGSALLVAAPFLAVMAAGYIARDFWYDELYTLDNFVFASPLRTVGYYPAPNNHILANLVLNLVMPLLGMADLETLLAHPWAARLVVLAQSLTALYLVFRMGISWYGQRVAILATALMATNLAFINFAVQIRGYAPSVMWAAVVLYLCLAYERGGGRWRAWAMGLAAALMMWTLPSNLYYLATLGGWWWLRWLWDLWRARRGDAQGMDAAARRRGGMVLWLAAGTVASIGLYAPVLGQMLTISNFATDGPFRHLHVLTRVLPQVAQGFLAGHWWVLLPAAAGVALAWRRGRLAFAPELGLCLFLGLIPFVLSWARGEYPFLRLFLNLAPVWALGLALALENLFLAWPRLAGRSAWALAAVYLALQGGMLATLHQIEGHITSDVLAGRRSQDLLFHYYHDHFNPRSTYLAILRQDPCRRLPVALAQTSLDPIAFGFYFERNGRMKVWGGLEELEAAMIAGPRQGLVVTNHVARFIQDVAGWRPEWRVELVEGSVGFYTLFRVVMPQPPPRGG